MFMSCETFTKKWTLSLRQLYKYLTSCYCYVCACRTSFRRLVLLLKVPHLWLATWVIWTACLLIRSVRRFYQVPGDWWKQIYITQWDYSRERIAVTGLHLLPGVFNELPIDSECRWTVFSECCWYHDWLTVDIWEIQHIWVCLMAKSFGA